MKGTKGVFQEQRQKVREIGQSSGKGEKVLSEGALAALSGDGLPAPALDCHAVSVPGESHGDHCVWAKLPLWHHSWKNCLAAEPRFGNAVSVSQL